MVLRAVLMYSTLLCNNLYGSMFCFGISLWGVVMLLLLGISCKIQAVALFEDVNIKEGEQDTNCTGGAGPGGKPKTLREENVTDAYNNAAWSCFGAAFLYACFLVLSTVLIVYHRRKKTV